MNELKEKMESDFKAAGVHYEFVPLPKEIADSPDLAVHAQFHKMPLKNMIATLVYRTESGMIALIKRADSKVKSGRLKKELGIRSLNHASAEEMKQLNYTPGHVSAFQHNIPVYIDKGLEELDILYCGYGDPNNCVKVSLETLQAMNPNTKLVSVTEVDRGEIRLDGSLRVLSGITPSSSRGLHLGNFLGAVQPHVQFQDKGQCFYFIADYHALNTVHDPKQFEKNVYETYLDYMALGIDLEKTTFFIESHVSYIFELTEILKNVVTLAQMKRMHAYKDKLEDPDQEIDQINMGLFNYPILMAADILAFEPDLVPVGEDQAQHVEICRDMARSFNTRYGDILKVPELYIKEDVKRVIGTDGERKMSKSLGNILTIFADEEEVKKEVMAITTDPNRIKKDDPGDPEKNPIFSYLRLMEYDPGEVADLESRYRAGSVGDVEVKELFNEFFINYFAEARNRREGIAADKEAIVKTIRENGEKANEVAKKTMEKVRESIGAVLR